MKLVLGASVGGGGIEKEVSMYFLPLGIEDVLKGASIVDEKFIPALKITYHGTWPTRILTCFYFIPEIGISPCP